MKNGKKIHIYGDYDADGIMGVSILVKMFEYLNYDVTYCVPSRYKDGYGINMSKASQMVKDGIGLCICVDNGVSAVEPIAFLRQNNVDVLVLDHHEAPEILPKANVILHPFLSKLSQYSTSGASVAFLFSVYMLKRFDKYLSTLASISIISDMMPLRGYNRDLLRIVFARYTEGEFYQIDLLKGNDPFDENAIGMSIAPKINSVGRIIEDSSINDIIKFFTSTSKDSILTYYNWINDLNNERKEASKSLLESDIHIKDEDASIVVEVEEKEGLIGLIANSLMNKYKKPSIVFTFNPEQGILKGSCRSQEGPSEGWLKFVQSNTAKTQIKKYLAKKNEELVREDKINKGRQSLIDAFKERNIDEKGMLDYLNSPAVFREYGVDNLDDLYVLVFGRKPTPNAIIDFLKIKKEFVLPTQSPKKQTKFDESPVYCNGADNIAISLANCCTPIPGDPIVGYVTKGKGISVHRADCPNIVNETERIIDVFWKEGLETATYPVDIMIEASDRANLVVDVMHALTNNHITINSISAKKNSSTLTATLSAQIMIQNNKKLNDIFAILHGIPGVYEVNRVTH